EHPRDGVDGQDRRRCRARAGAGERDQPMEGGFQPMSYINRGGLAPLEYKEADPNDPLTAIRALGESIDKKFGDLTGALKKTQDALDAEIAKRNRPGTEQKGEGDELEVKA